MSFAVDRFTCAVVFTVALLGCAREEPATDGALATRDAQRPLVVYVVSYPLRFMAERIGGPFVRVEFPLPAEVDPADWLPDAETVVAYTQQPLTEKTLVALEELTQRRSAILKRLQDAGILTIEDQVLAVVTGIALGIEAKAQGRAVRSIQNLTGNLPATPDDQAPHARPAVDARLCVRPRFGRTDRIKMQADQLLGLQLLCRRQHRW